ncbi:hypothetical protein C1X65_05425 [Pseudomonas sp. FW305-70]|nr:hypothetical protein C1X65_05425 [Pseudomonas sp. FW305-70]
MGASLLAKTVWQPENGLPDTPLSRAGSLPQYFGQHPVRPPSPCFDFRFAQSRGTSILRGCSELPASC